MTSLLNGGWGWGGGGAGLVFFGQKGNWKKLVQTPLNVIIIYDWGLCEHALWPTTADCSARLEQPSRILLIPLLKCNNLNAI